MSQRWSRDELVSLMAARYGQGEATGDSAYLDFRMRITPELLERLLGGLWLTPDGHRIRFDGVVIGDDGYADPIMVMTPAAGSDTETAGEAG